MRTDNRDPSHIHTALEQLSSEISMLTESADLADHFQSAVARSLHRLDEAVDELVDAWELQVIVELPLQIHSTVLILK